MWSFHLLIIVFIIILIITMVMFLIKKKSVGLIMLIAILILCGAGVVLYNTVFYNNSKYITITNKNNKEFTINIKNHLLQYEYTYAQFSSDVSFDILQKEVKSHYNNAYYDDTLDQYVFIEDNVIYTIKYYEHSKFLWMDRYKYLFSANTIEIENDSNIYKISFPREAIAEEEIFSTQMELKCGYEEIKPYYSAFTNAKFIDNKIILDYYTQKIVLSFKDNTVKIEIQK